MNDNRFEIIEKQGKLEQFRVIRDNQTGVLYLSNLVGYGLGMTVLVDANGKPLLDEDYLNSKS